MEEVRYPRLALHKHSGDYYLQHGEGKGTYLQHTPKKLIETDIESKYWQFDEEDARWKFYQMVEGIYSRKQGTPFLQAYFEKQAIRGHGYWLEVEKTNENKMQTNENNPD